MASVVVRRLRSYSWAKGMSVMNSAGSSTPQSGTLRMRRTLSGGSNFCSMCGFIISGNKVQRMSGVLRSSASHQVLTPPALYG